MAIKAVLFDIDGTLIDSVDLHAEAWQRSLAKFGIPIDFQSVRAQIGKGGDELMSVFLSEQDLIELGEELEAYRTALFRREYLPHVSGFAGARELFVRIREDGKRIALASSAKGEELAAYKRIAEVEGLTDEEASSDDVERSKPNPDIFQAALNGLKLLPHEAVVIGDTPYDAEAARKAELRMIGVLSGGFPEADLRSAGADEVYSGLTAILQTYEHTLIVRG